MGMTSMGIELVRGYRGIAADRFAEGMAMALFGRAYKHAHVHG